MALQAACRNFPAVVSPSSASSSSEVPPGRRPQRALPRDNNNNSRSNAGAPAPAPAPALPRVTRGSQQAKRARVPAGRGWERVESAQVQPGWPPSGSAQDQGGSSLGPSGVALWQGFWEDLAPDPTLETAPAEEGAFPAPVTGHQPGSVPLSGRQSASRSMQTILCALEASQRTPKPAALARPCCQQRHQPGASQESGIAAPALSRAAGAAADGDAVAEEGSRGGGQDAAAAAAQEWTHLLASLKEQRKYHEVVARYSDFVAELKQGTVAAPSAIPFNIAMSAALKLRTPAAEAGECAEAGELVDEEDRATGEGASACSDGQELQWQGEGVGETQREGPEGGQDERLGEGLAGPLCQEALLRDPEEGDSPLPARTQHGADSPPAAPLPSPHSVFEDMLSLGVCPSKATLRLVLASCEAPAVSSGVGTSAAGTPGTEQGEPGSAAGVPGWAAAAQGLPPAEAAAAILLRLERTSFGARPALTEWMAQILFGRPFCAPRLAAGVGLACSLGSAGVVLSRYTVMGALRAAKQLKVRSLHPELHRDLAAMLALSQQAYHQQQALTQQQQVYHQQQALHQQQQAYHHQQALHQPQQVLLAKPGDGERPHGPEGRAARPQSPAQRWTRQEGGVPGSKECGAGGTAQRKDAQGLLQ